jgi:hypothetical protein
MKLLHAIWEGSRWLLSRGARPVGWFLRAGKGVVQWVWPRIGRQVVEAAVEEAAQQAVVLVRDYAQRISASVNATSPVAELGPRPSLTSASH